MYRMTLVLLLLAVKLPMTAEEIAGVTVHQAEWGDTRGEAPPPSGPSVPIKSDDPAPVFQQKGFRYGQGLQYANRLRYGLSVRYNPGTRLRARYGYKGYRPGFSNRGAGKIMRSGTYRPNIRYGGDVKYRQGAIRYGFGH